MKMLDELLPMLSDGTGPNYSNFNYETPGLYSAVHFDASNISKYLQLHEMKPTDLPSILPPFFDTWWETSVASGAKRRIGAHAHTTGWGEGIRYNISEEDYGLDVQEDMAREVYWTAWIDTFPVDGMRGGLIRKPQYAIGVPIRIDGKPFLDTDGQIVARDLTSNPLLHTTGPGSYAELKQEEELGRVPGFTAAGWRQNMVKIGIRTIWPFLVAVGFSHLKNVEIVEAPELPYKVRRKQELKLGKPLIQFKELVIDPMATQRRVVGDRILEEERKRLLSRHIVRGHIATYTEDRPRFGRAKDGVGSFWISPHLRGSDEVGTVYKDYKVKGPANA